ncbi:hypothetical protein J5069_04565 [Candidatus Symbiopectobacterium sp. NZEC127]|uniref:hypothetical protein n=1 Tax=Candidatus Symbiopectobacterium sp. NZEC127 TaxID=2820472 RepID=UPI002225C872|nr:hypothetical protein [Candidatus Symbiopectobacterium sp. NZEC127]MCW2485167.1 hypothetical protein [Candidatus Symbiopectobacterium sp. NZEC127]
MYKQVGKSDRNKNKSFANSVSQKKGNGRKSLGFIDNRPEIITEKNKLGAMNESPQVLQQGSSVNRPSPFVITQGTMPSSINKGGEVVKQLICIEKKTWKKVSDDNFFPDTHIFTENFDTVEEYKELIANYKHNLGGALVDEIQKECETRYVEAQEQHWYQTAKYLGFDVEGIITEKDFDISNSKWSRTLVEDELFFHGTRRTPKETLGSLDEGTLGTGFVAEDLRDERAKKSLTVPPVKWRTTFDDINLKSAVCLAKDVRGSAFFPLTGEVTDEQRRLDDHKPIYLYAIRVKAGAQVVNTYGAQSSLEEFERTQEEGTVSDYDRLTYDPGYEIEEGENADCRWQFQEHAVSEVTPDQIVGVWSVERTRFIETNLEGGERAGVRFRIHEESQFDPIVRPSVGSEKVAKKAKEIVSQYQQFYPTNPQDYLSYMGIVRDMAKAGSKPTSFQEARSAVKPVIPDVTNIKSPGKREDDQFIW